MFGTRASLSYGPQLQLQVVPFIFGKCKLFTMYNLQNNVIWRVGNFVKFWRSRLSAKLDAVDINYWQLLTYHSR